MQSRRRVVTHTTTLQHRDREREREQERERDLRYSGEMLQHTLSHAHTHRHRLLRQFFFFSRKNKFPPRRNPHTVSEEKTALPTHALTHTRCATYTQLPANEKRPAKNPKIRELPRESARALLLPATIDSNTSGQKPLAVGH